METTQQPGPTLAQLAEGGAAPKTDPTEDDRYFRVKVTNVYLTDGKGPQSGLFILRGRTGDDARLVGQRCAQMTGGLPWSTIPPFAQDAIFYAASLYVLGTPTAASPGSSLPAWFSAAPFEQIPDGLCNQIMAEYEAWRAESFRAGEGAGAAASRRPVVERLRPVGGAAGAAA